MPVRSVRRALGWTLAPADVLRLVRADAHPVALSGAWAGGRDVVCAGPVLVRSGPGPLADILDAPFPPADESPAGPAFGGGWIGYLGYSAGSEALPASGPRRLPPGGSATTTTPWSVTGRPGSGFSSTWKPPTGPMPSSAASPTCPVAPAR